MGLKYKLKKLRVRIKTTKPKDLDLDDIQTKAYDIIIQMINDSSSELLVDPDNSRKGIVNKDVFINIRKGKISVINGVYHYDVPIDDRIHEDITQKFYSKLTRKFNARENQVEVKIKSSLDNIKKNISSK